MSASFELQNLTEIKISPDTLALFKKVSDFAFPHEYELNVVLCDSPLSQELNRTHRHKDHPTNVLSFPLSETSGEIFIDLEQARKEHEAFGREYENFLLFLFIHGIVHLKGYEHGSRMEKVESEIRRNFDI